jgi:SAM-dependent methyltransferase
MSGTPLRRRLRRLAGRALRFSRAVWDRFPVRVAIRLPRPQWPGEQDRLEYQADHCPIEIGPDDRVLDIGCGPFVFRQATVLADRDYQRVLDARKQAGGSQAQFVVADVCRLPFRRKAFDFVYCAHVLEHVEDPLQACREITRVGRRGYMETPTLMKDALFAWAEKAGHRWHVVGIADILAFFEYSEPQKEGVASAAWRDRILAPYYHPLQKAYYNNRHLFNVLFRWAGSFRVFVFRLDGSVHTN